MLIGYKNYRDDILIAADSRITFSSSGRVIETRDELQKVYFFNEGIAVGFASNDISIVRNIFRIIKKENSFDDDNNRFIGLLKQKSKNIRVSTSFILGILKNGRNQLFSYTIINGEVKPKEIKSNEYMLLGSAKSEGGDSLKKSVLDLTFGKPGYDIPTYVKWLTSSYAIWAEKNEMQTVGQLLYTVEGSDNYFGVIPYETMIDTNSSIGNVSLEYDKEKNIFYQYNRMTGSRKDLLAIDRVSLKLLKHSCIFQWITKRNSR